MNGTLLIVDDQDPIRFGLAEYFRIRNYGVEAAACLEEAKALIHRKAFDLVLTDLRLSGSGYVEGLDVVSEVQAAHPKAFAVLLTAYGSPAVEAAARHLGVHRFLLKPIPLPVVEQEVANLLASAA